MKVLYLVTVPESLVFVEGRAAAFADRGITVAVCSSAGDRLNSFGRAEGCVTYEVPFSRSVNPIGDISAIAALVKVIREFRPDIVHGMTPKAGLVGMIAARLARTPVAVYEILGLPHDSATGWQRRALLLSERVSCRLADEVYAVSESMMRIARADRLARRAKFRMFLHGSVNGVDTCDAFNPASHHAREDLRREFGIADEATMVLFVGRLTADKGINELHRAWQMAVTREPALHLLVVGEQDSRAPLDSSVIDRLARTKNVQLMGHFDHADIPRLMNAADILVLPTYREGFPNVLLEAAAMALPVIATDVAGCTDTVVDGQTGTLVPVGDSKALSDAIIDYASNRILRKRHGAAARQRSEEQFTQPLVWSAICRTYERLSAPADGGNNFS